MIPQAGMGVQGLTGANSQGASHPPAQMQQYLPQGKIVIFSQGL